MKITVILSLIYSLVLSVAQFWVLVPAQATVESPGADQSESWVAIHIFDSIYPMTDTQSFPEALNSLEIIHQLYTEKSIFSKNRTGSRSREGHFLIWAHFSKSFLKKHPINRQEVGDSLFLFPDRESDVFTAWSGDVNLVALLTQGLQGLAVPLKISDASGSRLSGNFQNFTRDIQSLGDADFAGGWFMNDTQSAKLLSAFKSYPGIKKGYSFMRWSDENPNQLKNGYNCGDFVFYALSEAGVIPKEVSESFQIQFWYPSHYLRSPIPLRGVGARGEKWIRDHPFETTLPGNILVKLAWYDLLFSPFGVEFFDKEAIVNSILETRPKLEFAKIWDQAHAIDWLKKSADFESKGIVTEILPTVRSQGSFQNPFRSISKTAKNDYLLSPEFNRSKKRGKHFENRKLTRAGLKGRSLTDFKVYYDQLKPAH